MPLPKPRKNEEENDFVIRCMKELRAKKEFKDEPQRFAVCFSKYREEKRKIL